MKAPLNAAVYRRRDNGLPEGLTAAMAAADRSQTGPFNAFLDASRYRPRPTALFQTWLAQSWFAQTWLAQTWFAQIWFAQIWLSGDASGAISCRSRASSSADKGGLTTSAPPLGRRLALSHSARPPPNNTS